jgi:CubicO group peptidase (beta-lactamase class C family)
VVTHLTGKVNPHDCAKFEAGLEVCATDIDAYMRANVLLPLGMASSGYFWDATMEKHLARGHDETGEPRTIRQKPTAPAMARYAAAGGLCTTPTDYARFLIAVMDPKPRDAFHLKKKSVQEMLRPQVKINDSNSWALGWQIHHTEKGDFICHGGGNPGFSCFVVGSVSRKSGLVVMTNADHGYHAIDRLLRGEILHRFLGVRMPLPQF